jgi:four helix bundle protein
VTGDRFQVSGFRFQVAGYRLQVADFGRGSALEIQTQLVIAQDLGFGDPVQIERAEKLAEEISRMLWAIIQRL